MKRKATRFVVLNEEKQVVVRESVKIKKLGWYELVKTFKFPKEANEWASENLGNWVVLEQVQWESNRLSDHKWYTQKLH